MDYNSTQQHFYQDEKRGRKVELELLELLHQFYPRAFKIEGNFKWFDIEIPEIKCTVEVKFDEKSETSGNFFVETSSSFSPSGITTSTAKWFVFADNTYTFWILTETLRFYLKDKTERSFTISGIKKTGYLIDKNTFSFSPYVAIRRRDDTTSPLPLF